MGQSTLVKTYNPDEVSIAIGPVLIESGFAEDEFIRIEAEADDAVDYAGVDGEVTVTRSNDRRATLTVILQQTADANDGLNVLSAAFRTAPAGVGGIFPIVIRDRNGRAVYQGNNAWVLRPPDAAFGRSPGTREWKIRIAHLARVDGGNVGQ